MEKKIRKVVRLAQVDEDISDIYHYGLETFGEVTAELFLADINHQISGPSYQFNLYPECRFLKTKSKMYRNVVIGKYLIIYRITPERIEILRALHGSRSVRVIKAARSIKP